MGDAQNTYWDDIQKVFGPAGGHLQFSTGFWAPADWGSNWRTARAAASTRQVNVVGFGHSVMQGFYSSSFKNRSWFGRVVNALQTLYGDGGSGAASVANITGITAGAASDITTAGGTLGTATGGLDKLAAGLNSYGVFPHAAGNGASVTFNNVRGTTIDVVYYPSVGASTMGVQIDGGSVQTFNSQGAGTKLQTSTYQVNPGNHTVVITFPTGQPILEDVRGRNSTGIVGFNYGLAGRQSADVSLASSLSNAGWTTTGGATIQQSNPDLFFYEMGVNDVSGSVSANNFGQSVSLAMDYARAANPLCEIVIVGEHRGNIVDTTPLYPSYMREQRAIAESYGAIWLNFWPIGRNSYSYWNGLGFWGDGTNDGLAGSDSVHGSDAMYAFMANAILPLLTA